MASGEPSLIARLLSGSLAGVLRRLGRRPSTEDEIQVLLKEGIEAGIFDEAEQEIVTRVFELGDYRASELMTPMNKIVWLDVAAWSGDGCGTPVAGKHPGWTAGLAVAAIVPWFDSAERDASPPLASLTAAPAMAASSKCRRCARAWRLSRR